MDLVEQAVLRWQRLNQPRRFRESLAGAGEHLVCALAPHERAQMLREAALTDGAVQLKPAAAIIRS